MKVWCLLAVFGAPFVVLLVSGKVGVTCPPLSRESRACAHGPVHTVIHHLYVIHKRALSSFGEIQRNVVPHLITGASEEFYRNTSKRFFPDQRNEIAQEELKMLKELTCHHKCSAQDTWPKPVAVS